MIDNGQDSAFTSGNESGGILRRCNERLFVLVCARTPSDRASALSQGTKNAEAIAGPPPITEF